MNSLRNLLFSLTLLALFSAPIAKAQVSVYGTGMVTGFGFANNSSFGFGTDSAGLGGGALYDFPTTHLAVVGIDVRGSNSFGTHGGQNFAVAARVSFAPERSRLRPYIELGGGVINAREQQFTFVTSGGITSSVVTSTKNVSNGAVDLMFGLDVKINPSWSVRAVEYGGAAGGNNSNQAGMGWLSAGVVFHFHADKPQH